MTTHSADKAVQSYYFHEKYKSLPHPAGKNDKTFSGRHYRCYKESGQNLVFSSHNYRKGHAANIFLSDSGENENNPDYILKLRGSFPLTGKIDLLRQPASELAGVITRGRKVYDQGEQLFCRFVDGRSWKEHLGEGTVDIIGNMIFGGGDGNAGAASGANSYILEIARQPMGVLYRKELPFFPDPPAKTEPGIAGKVIKKILPANLGRALIDVTPPVGWCLDLHSPLEGTELYLALFGALMTVEIRGW